MSKIAEISEPASELEHLIADLSESGPLVFVFGVGWWTAHLTERQHRYSADPPTGGGGTSSSATTRELDDGRAGR